MLMCSTEIPAVTKQMNCKEYSEIVIYTYDNRVRRFDTESIQQGLPVLHFNHHKLVLTKIHHDVYKCTDFMLIKDNSIDELETNPPSIIGQFVATVSFSSYQQSRTYVAYTKAVMCEDSRKFQFLTRLLIKHQRELLPILFLVPLHCVIRKVKVMRCTSDHGLIQVINN